jgi:tetratricopeptide (TPR) repeat protein
VRADRSSAPALPADLDPADLDPSIRGQLRALDKVDADAIAGHLLMTAELLDEDPELALRHAVAARDLGARVGAVREAVGIAAYRAGEWALARTELRTARRITGDARHLPLLADCERALGKPELAVKLLDEPEAAKLDAPARAELLIVVASARRDMGQSAAAMLLIQRRGPEWIDRRRPSEAALRVWFVYADLLAELDRKDEAAEWFTAILRHDPTDELGVRDQMRELKLPLA